MENADDIHMKAQVVSAFGYAVNLPLSPFSILSGNKSDERPAKRLPKEWALFYEW